MIQSYSAVYQDSDCLVLVHLYILGFEHSAGSGSEGF